MIDTGSATTIISTETAIGLGFRLHLDDELILVRGVGAGEYLYERYMEGIVLDNPTVNNFKVNIGAMQYCFGIDAIVGMDILGPTKAIVNLHEMTLTPLVQP